LKGQIEKQDMHGCWMHVSAYHFEVQNEIIPLRKHMTREIYFVNVVPCDVSGGLFWYRKRNEWRNTSDSPLKSACFWYLQPVPC
jgi:hypothetical protein